MVCTQRLYFLRKLNSFRVESAILSIFYSSTVQSLITFGITCYGCNLAKSQILRIDRVINKAAKIIKCELPSFEELLLKAVSKKATLLQKDSNHPLHTEYVVSDRSGRYLSKKSNTERYKNTFIPTSIRLLQSEYKRPEVHERDSE